jgi:hypothetical protein
MMDAYNDYVVDGGDDNDDAVSTDYLNDCNCMCPHLQDGECKGYAFAEFSSADHAQLFIRAYGE